MPRDGALDRWVKEWIMVGYLCRTGHHGSVRVTGYLAKYGPTRPPGRDADHDRALQANLIALWKASKQPT